MERGNNGLAVREDVERWKGGEPPSQSHGAGPEQSLEWRRGFHGAPHLKASSSPGLLV